jgi:hypothetical protein
MIEIATFWLAASYLNRLHYRLPQTEFMVSLLLLLIVNVVC